MIVNAIALQPTRECQTTAAEGHVSGVRRRTDDDDVDAEQEQQRHVRAPAVHEPAELPCLAFWRYPGSGCYEST